MAAVAAVLVVVASSFVAAAAWRRHQSRVSSPAAARTRLEERAVGRAEARAATVPTAAADVAMCLPSDGMAVRPRREAAAAARTLSKAPPQVSAAAAAVRVAANDGVNAPISDSAVQATLLTRGLTLLHRDHDPPSAIAAFAEYRSRFPAGLFIEEATAALVEAHLAARHEAEALSLLERKTFAPGAPGSSGALGERERAQLTLRGELRGRFGRCGKAVEDFDAVLDASFSTSRDVRERARFGRGVCHAKLGHSRQARDDFETYAREFPDGRFIGEVKKQLP